MQSSQWKALHGLSLIGTLVAAAGCATTQRAIAPPTGKGPVAIVISGYKGPSTYEGEAQRIAKLGYYTVLLDGKDIDPRYGDRSKFLRDAIARAQSAPEAVPGKVVVIGFSMGGGGALVSATPMGDLVAAVVAYYPMVTHLSKSRMESLASRLEVPVLVLAGEDDTYETCCLATSQRALEAAARSQGKPYELILYPGAGHAFNFMGPSSAQVDAERRTDEMLKRYRSP
jgi:dienelactone hydrolase